MRYIITSLTLLCFTCYQVFSQQVYERSYPSGSVQAMDWGVTYSTLDNTLWYTVTDGSDILLHHLSSTGVITATYKYAGINPTNVNMEQSVNGLIYISGLTQVTTGVEYFVLAVDFTGAVAWSKKYAINAMASYDRSRLRVLANGNVMMIQSVYGHMGYIELDGLTGTVVNSAQFREDTTFENKTPGFAGDVFGDGSFVFTGKRGADIAIVHSDASGNILWSRVMNSGWSYYHTKGVAACDDGSTIACGTDNGAGFVMKLDQNGTMQWYNAFALNITFYDVEQIDSSSFGMCGTVGSDFVYSRFDMNGNELGTIKFTYPGWSFFAHSIAVNASGTVALPFKMDDPSWSSGPTAGLLLMEPGFSLECGMSSFPLVASTSSSDPSVVNVPIYRCLEPVFVSNMPVTASVQPTGVTSDICVILAVPQPEAATDLSLQNSPAGQGQAVTFAFGTYRGDVRYVVTDALGREVMRREINYNGGSIPIEGSEGFASGMYVLAVENESGMQTQKFVIR